MRKEIIIMAKKILIINGSPRKSGNTETLVDSLIKGVTESGNTAIKMNLRELNIKTCVGCFQCQAKKGDPCVQKDDMNKIYSAYKEADAVVFASPLYWMHFSGQMKVALDRLFAFATYEIPKKDTALIIASTMREEDGIFKMIVPYYENCIVNVLNWNNKGMILAGGVNDIGDVKNTEYIEKAYELGKML
jgi:multimeric flavodoxin WrbA